VPTSAKPSDIAHFAVVGRVEAEAEDERIARAAVTPPGERILAGFRMGTALPMTPELLAEIDSRADGQMELARRRIALGLTSKQRA
jgi:hypothetical protein